MKLQVRTEFKISNQEFDLLRDLIKKVTGINLSDQKKMLVVSRLSKRLCELGLNNYMDYYTYLTENESGGCEVDNLINRITTNKTDFYRERHHFDFLIDTILPRLYKEGSASGSRRLRIWSAGCSSGEEPYTIATTLREFFKDKPGWDIKILATDLDTDILSKAMAGTYKADVVQPIPGNLLREYFKRGRGANAGLFQAKDTLKDVIVFRRHNLVYDDLPVRRPFDIIFCRNVIIYFDEATKRNVLNRFYGKLKIGGHLFLGHSESLLGSNEDFELVANSTYRKSR